jgi:hypothetical protein
VWARLLVGLPGVAMLALGGTCAWLTMNDMATVTKPASSSLAR